MLRSEGTIVAIQSDLLCNTWQQWSPVTPAQSLESNGRATADLFTRCALCPTAWYNEKAHFATVKAQMQK